MYEDEAQSCVLLVTRMDFKEKSITRQAAYEWATDVIRHICDSSGTIWEGQLKASIPLRAVVDGFLFKVILMNVPDDLVSRALIPGMEQRLCTVKRLEQQLAEADRKRADARLAEVKKRVHDLADVGKVESLITELAAMRGTGGPEGKQRKFANDGMSVLSTCVRISASQLDHCKADTE